MVEIDEFTVAIKLLLLLFIGILQMSRSYSFAEWMLTHYSYNDRSLLCVLVRLKNASTEMRHVHVRFHVQLQLALSLCLFLTSHPTHQTKYNFQIWVFCFVFLSFSYIYDVYMRCKQSNTNNAMSTNVYKSYKNGLKNESYADRFFPSSLPFSFYIILFYYLFVCARCVFLTMFILFGYYSCFMLYIVMRTPFECARKKRSEKSGDSKWAKIKSGRQRARQQ